MEKIYPTHKDTCKLIKTRQEKIQFLLDYSKSLQIVAYKDTKFENNIN